MKSPVECRAGYGACDHPTAVFLEGKRYEVLKILAEWRTPLAKRYRLLLENGAQIEVELTEEKDWHIQTQWINLT